MRVNSDLHIHSNYSAATSPRMDLPTLAKEAARKGIQLLGTGDCLHPKWLSGIKDLDEKDGIFYFKGKEDGTNFALTVEVEDNKRVHHLLILPSIAKAEQLYESFRNYSADIDSDGRPSLRLSGAEIAEHAKDAEALIGPCHAFTPWTALYAYHNSLSECYCDMSSYVSFVELGLSADSSYADKISELHGLTFLTNSDAHSPYPIRLAREFNRFQMDSMTFEDLKAAIERRNGRKPVLNVGLPPKEGKYNESACIRCYKHYSLREATIRKWRCECKGMIKKGVRDRVNELADCDGTPPEHRPPYMHLIPLAEIIGLAVQRSASSKTVTGIWESLLAEFGTEVNVLVDADMDEHKAMTLDARVVDAISAFRAGKIAIIPGGGGKYGVIALSLEGHEDAKEEEHEREQKGQRSLFDF
ncbi:MAG: TIGR00375 family protein [Euryarchaeota archaeon]|nr:TIGR00375 family protein [Euryarchaeota archaeon]